MIHDIDDELYHSILSSFVDDTRLMKEISNHHDVQLLQNDLESVYKWTEFNNMQLNGLKFEHMRYGKNKPLKENSIYLSDTHNQIKIKNQVKDLALV